jgi:hypothetical protein
MNEHALAPAFRLNESVAFVALDHFTLPVATSYPGAELDASFPPSSRNPTIDGEQAWYQARHMKQMPTALFLFFIATGTMSAEQVMIAGIGSRSCTHWKSTPELHAEGEKWALGFWSGLNYVAAVTKQQNQLIIDPQEMLDQIEKMCSERPSQSLADTVWITFLTLNKSRP